MSSTVKKFHVMGKLGVIDRHYTSLSSAFADINAGTTSNAIANAADAKVKVTFDNTRSVVTLLDNLTETNQLIVQKDVALVLDGNSLTLSNAGYNIVVQPGASLRVDGSKDGSKIDLSIASETNTGMFDVSGKLEIAGGRYCVNIDSNNAALFIRGLSTSEYVKIRDCHIECANTNNTVTAIQYVGQELVVERSSITCSNIARCQGLLIQTNAVLDNVALNVGTQTSYAFGIRAAASSTVACRDIQIDASAIVNEAFGIILESGTDLSIDGGKIIVTSDEHIVYGINQILNDAYDDNIVMTIDNVEIVTTSHAPRVTNNSSTDQEDGTILDDENTSTTTKLGGGIGIRNYGTATITNSVILADAMNEKSNEGCTVGISNYGQLVCKNLRSYGTHSGIQHISNVDENENLGGDLYVKDCLLSGISHGGLYVIKDQNHSAIINDTILEVGVYHGQFKDTYAELFKTEPTPTGISALAAMYFGSHSHDITGGDLYMDNCTFVGLGGESFVVRPQGYTSSGMAEGKHPNRLFISRSKIAVRRVTWDSELWGTTAKIRLNKHDSFKYVDSEFSQIYCGEGNNFTVDDLNWGQESFITTGERYRQNDPYVPTAEDYRNNRESSAVIDVAELPLRNIKRNAIYRLTSGYLAHNGRIHDNARVHIVDVLPKVGLPATNSEYPCEHSYYNTSENKLYAYVDQLSSSAVSLFVGWHNAVDVWNRQGDSYGGVITNLDQAVNPSTWYLLLKYDLYTYNNGWRKLIFGYETNDFDIRWNGVIGTKFALDMTALGKPNISLVKVSDEVLTTDMLIGATYTQVYGFNAVILEEWLDTNTYPGIITVDGGSIVIVYSENDANAAFGLPEGTITNGTYFVYNTNKSPADYTDRLVSAPKLNSDHLRLTSPNGTRFRITVDDSGALSATKES